MCAMARQYRTRNLDSCLLMTVDRTTVIGITFVGKAPGGAQRRKCNRVTSLWNAAEVSVSASRARVRLGEQPQVPPLPPRSLLSAQALGNVPFGERYPASLGQNG